LPQYRKVIKTVVISFKRPLITGLIYIQYAIHSSMSCKYITCIYHQKLCIYVLVSEIAPQDSSNYTEYELVMRPTRGSTPSLTEWLTDWLTEWLDRQSWRVFCFGFDFDFLEGRDFSHRLYNYMRVYSCKIMCDYSCIIMRVYSCKIMRVYSCIIMSLQLYNYACLQLYNYACLQLYNYESAVV
jgi:hypothetical protein